jgi:hypothetical protein
MIHKYNKSDVLAPSLFRTFVELQEENGEGELQF